MELFKNPDQEKLINELDEYINKRSEIIENSAKVIEKYNLIYKDTSTYESEVFDIPESLLTVFQQYFLFFREYLNSAKGLEIDFEVNKVPNGLYFTFNLLDVAIDKIQEYLNEYLDFARNNNFSIINIEDSLSSNEIDFFKAKT